VLHNAQPMGFYAPAQIVRDARDQGVDVRLICIKASRWDCTLEPAGGEDRLAVRFGLRMVRGLSNVNAAAIIGARVDQPFASLDDLWHRPGVPAESLVRIAEADGFQPSVQSRMGPSAAARARRRTPSRRSRP
jgi:error-prone DNA polymerase